MNAEALEGTRLNGAARRGRYSPDQERAVA
jgi:hypothetical protein